jgi:hypothetical protein
MTLWVCACVLVTVLGGGDYTVNVTGYPAERVVASWAAQTVHERRVEAQEIIHEASTGAAAVVTPAPPPTTTTISSHPCDLIPVPGPGPVFIEPQTIALCPLVAPWFDPGDLFRALVTIECESNGRPYENDHWREAGYLHGHTHDVIEDPPWGIWSILGSWHGEARSMFGPAWDPYSTTDSSRFAAWLVYDTPGSWGHWSSCNDAGVAETVRRHDG